MNENKSYNVFLQDESDFYSTLCKFIQIRYFECCDIMDCFESVICVNEY